MSNNILKKRTLGKAFNFREFGVLLALILLCVIMSVLSPVFLKANNLITILQQMSITFIIGAGATFVILTGGIDLSVGSIVAVSGFILATLIKSFNVPTGVAILVALVFGTLMGCLNGVLIAKVKLPAFIATLGTMYILRGVSYTVSKGQTVFSLPDDLLFFASSIGKIPVPVFLLIIVFIVSAYILKYTKIGRYVYAVGGNEVSSNLSGINVDKVKIFAYSLAGFFSAIAAIMLVAKLDAATPTAGEGYEMEAISAVVIGGASMSGGEGKVFGTLLGALIIGVIGNGMNLLGIAQGPQKIVKGAIIVLAVVLDVVRRSRVAKKT